MVVADGRIIYPTKKAILPLSKKLTKKSRWKIPLYKNQPTLVSNPPETAAQKQVANGIIKVNTTKSELADYYAATLFSPAKYTLL